MAVIFFALTIVLVGAVDAEISCNVTTFGATGDGVSYDTPAIQQTIDSCAAEINEQDGDDFAVVIIPAPGRYLTGTLFLRSRTILHISPGATLLASPSQDHYPALESRWYLILAENVSNVGITGSDVGYTEPNVGSDVGIPGPADVGATSSDVGVIDGQSCKFVESFNSIKNVMVSWNQTGACYGDECRPRLLGFLDCDRVHIWNIQLHQPAYWW
ncbi:hypothetical protein GOP47_0008427 [Adiantum capillus-veneris]|uniref:Rhamnogalacturonase A/B/Epimerase-like pectate lyase domain-containing protein n=1 Tax=Adiantum capillus-veneris TaxID=13818 RepID=A0A9D4UZS0_ADICA|nr:hypothetical protein GOP47_0008427 [Adiantum capillus-veneris]